MLSVDAIYDAVSAAMQRAAADDNTADLTEMQLLAAYLMRPAEAIGDAETARRFQLLAANAANAREEIERRRDE